MSARKTTGTWNTWLESKFKETPRASAFRTMAEWQNSAYSAAVLVAGRLFLRVLKPGFTRCSLRPLKKKGGGPRGCNPHQGLFNCQQIDTAWHANRVVARTLPGFTGTRRRWP